MSKLTEYPQATSFDANDILIKDGINGTKKIRIEDFIATISDTTQTVEGKLAKAGDVAELQSAVHDTIIPKELYSDGIFFTCGITASNGENASSSTLISTDYVDVSGYSRIAYSRAYTTSTTSTYGMAFYDSNKTYISGERCAIRSPETEWKVQEIDVPQNAKYARFSYVNTLPLSDFQCYVVDDYVCNLEETVEKNSVSVADIENRLNVVTLIEPTFSQGSWALNGNLNTVGSQIRTAPFQVGKCRIRLNSGYAMQIGSWNTTSGSENSFQGSILGSLSSMAYNMSEYEFEGEENRYYRVAIKALDGRSLDPTTDKVNVQIFEVTDKLDNKADNETVQSLLAEKINWPEIGYGSVGTILTSNGTNHPTWQAYEPLSGSAVTDAVNSWLENNPQAFLSIADRSITEPKFALTALRYVTPEMFGAAADGITPDDRAIQDAIDYAVAHHVIVEGLGKTYAIDGSSVHAPWAHNIFVYHGPYLYGSVIMQNFNIFVLPNSPGGTRGLSVKCIKGEKIIIDNVNIDGNRENQSAVLVGNGQMHGMSLGVSTQYDDPDGTGSIIVRNCTIKDCYTDCITAAATDFELLRVENCVFVRAGRNGITDNSLNGTFSNCTFINNGVRTDPKVQYEAEPESARDYSVRTIENCKFISDYDNIRDIVFLFKIVDSKNNNKTNSIEHLIISGCKANVIAVASQTKIYPSTYKHITIKDCTCDTVRFAPADGAISDNQNMHVENCKFGNLKITTGGNITVDGCDISSGVDIVADDLIMTRNRISRDEAITIAPTAVNAIIDGNIFRNVTLSSANITTMIGNNVSV